MKHFVVGDRVTIMHNVIQPNYVGRTGIIYKIYSKNGCNLYKVKVNNTVLKGVALETDIIINKKII